MEWRLVIDLCIEEMNHQNPGFAPVEPEANPAEDDDQSAGHIDLEGHYNAIIKQE